MTVRSSLSLAMVGDVMLGRIVNEVLALEEASYPWGDTLPVLESADLRLCNLECVISNKGEPWAPKMFHFRSDSKNVATLTSANINGVSLANNHVLDFGYDAFSEMLDVLDKHGIHRAGAGRSLVEAERPSIFVSKSVKIGVLAFTDNEPDWEAKQDRAGVFYTPIELHDVRAVRLLELVEKTKEGVDLLIVSAHWGPNWGYNPPKEHIQFAHALVDAGTDIVYGHSCHVFRGIEVYNGAAILYCTGDFVDDYAVDPVERNDESFIFILKTKGRDIVQMRLYPTVIEECQARLASGSRSSTIASKMEYLSEQLKTRSVWEERLGYLRIDL